MDDVLWFSPLIIKFVSATASRWPLAYTALRISERRSRLLGLDAPHTVEARARVDILSWSQAMRDFVDIHKEVFGDGRDDERTQILAKKMDELVAERLSNN